MKEEYKDFVGIYDESVPVDLCNEFVENYELAKKNRTIVDVKKENELNIPPDKIGGVFRKDESAFVAPILSTIYPIPPVKVYFEYLKKCFISYTEKYNFIFNGTIYNDVFKIHKVRKSEGYHVWHCEKDGAESLDRLMAYMTYLEVPKRGGETEFLHQSLRIDPVVGRTLIWPAGFTHVHRGNPPLDGEKMYITGWFNAAKVATYPNP
jgi:prolyl 4-hydroxylase